MRGPHPSLAVAAALLRAPERTEAALSRSHRAPPTLMAPFWKLGVAPCSPPQPRQAKASVSRCGVGAVPLPLSGLRTRLLEGPEPDFSPRSPLASECLDAGHMLGQRLGTRFLGSYLELAVIPEEIFLLSVSRPHGTSWAPRSPGVDSMPCLWLPGWLGSATLSL